MARTKTEAALLDAEREFSGDPERAELVARARRFKASWIELGEALSTVRGSGQWKKWGHPSFDDYTRRELHLRKETADKLTGSFSFLQRTAPDVLLRDGGGAPIPSYQSVDFLRRAEEQEGAPAETVSEIRRRVLDDGAQLPALVRKYREVLFPLDDAERNRRDRDALRQAARRLRELLDGTSSVKQRVATDALAALDILLAALPEDESKAA